MHDSRLAAGGHATYYNCPGIHIQGRGRKTDAATAQRINFVLFSPARRKLTGGVDGCGPGFLKKSKLNYCELF